MKMQNWLVSSVLGLTLAGATGCGPQEQPAPTPAPEASQPQQEDDGRTVSAMAATTITWDDFTKVRHTYISTCVNGAIVDFTCDFCAADPLYDEPYRNSSCGTSASTGICRSCERTWVYDTLRVELPDGDLIDVTIEHNATASDGVEFRLESAPVVTWWKQVGLVGGGDHWKVWNENGNSWCNWPNASTANCNTNSQWASVVMDPGSYFIFSKSKGIFGVHTEMYKLYNLSERLTGGDRVTFRWIKD